MLLLSIFHTLTESSQFIRLRIWFNGFLSADGWLT